MSSQSQCMPGSLSNNSIWQYLTQQLTVLYFSVVYYVKDSQ